MFGHLGNCHGEWNLLFTGIAGLPFMLPSVRRWLRRLVARKPACPCGDSHDRGEEHAS